MQTIYWAHSYRDEDAPVNRHFGHLLDAEDIVVNFDPPSEKVNPAKLERNLRGCDGMVAILGWRDRGPSPYILYEISMCLRAHKPVLVYIDHRLPDPPIPSRVLQMRFSHTTYVHQIREQQYAMRTLKNYIGDTPPPRYQPTSGQRACGVVGWSALSPSQRADLETELVSRGFRLVDLEDLDLHDPFLFDAHDRLGSLDLAISCVDAKEPSAFYLRGALTAEAVPTISFSAAKGYMISPAYPESLQSRIVDQPGRKALPEMLREELDVYDQLFLTAADVEAIDRYTRLQLKSRDARGRYEPGTRREYVEVIMGNKHTGDTYSISGQAGAVGPQARVEHATFTQNWQQLANTIDMSRLADELAQLRTELERVGRDPEQKLAAGAVAAAEESARRNDGAKALEYLAAAGTWVLGVAEKIGVAVATAAIKSALGV